MIDDDKIIGGVIITINENNHNHLDFLFVKVGVQSKGVGWKIWKEIEELYYKLYQYPFPKFTFFLVGQWYRLKFLIENHGKYR